MLIVVSPAKSLDYESPLATKKASEARLLDEASLLVDVMAKKSPGDLQELMHISPSLAELNFDRFQDWQRPFTTESARPAVLAFSGDVYMGLEAPSFSERDFTHAQKVFRILSGLYGVLRPLDLMMPYRLEMGSKLANERGKDLYAFWRDDVTKLLSADIEDSPGANVLVNLASNEYFGAVDPVGLGHRIISPVFLDSKDGGPHKIVSFFAKKARGSMSQWLIKNRVTSIKGITDFDGMGYRLDADQSSPDRPVFTRSNQRRLMVTYPQTSFTAPAGSTRITLVRHGQTEPADLAKPFPLKHGHGDPNLTELGERQAVKVADRLEHEHIDGVYVTSLIRTYQTAAPLLPRVGLEPVEEHDLREIFLGDWEGGLFRHMLADEHPAALKFRETYEWGSVPGAETNAELIARTSAALHGIHSRHADEHIVCFVHGGVIAALCAHAAKTEMRSFSGADNCSIHRLVLTDQRWFLRGFNDSTHLGDTMTPQAVIDTPA